MENSKPLTAAERAERRKKRILEGSTARLNNILSGPDGTEVRRAPAMEGGEVTSLPPSSTESTPPMSPTVKDEPQPTIANVVDKNRRFISFLFGLFCRLVMLYSGLHANIMLPWILVYASVEFLLLRKIRNANGFPDELKAMLEMLPQEAFAAHISLFASLIKIARELAQDTMFMTAGFILTQYALILSDYYIST